MEKKTGDRRIKIIWVLSALCAALFILTAMNTAKIKELERETEVQRQKYLSELCESLDSMTVSLNKSLCTSTAEMLHKNGNDLSKQAAIAKVSLSGITDERLITDEIYKFLSQAGDYALYLSRKDNFRLSEKEEEKLRALHDYSGYLSQAFEQISNDYYSGRVAFTEKVNNLLSAAEKEGITFTESFTDVQQTMGDYPTLLYDGPFADAVLNKKALGLIGDEITSREAKKRAAEYLGCDEGGLKKEADTEGAIDLYCFSCGDRAVGITKKGGMLCYMTDSSYAGEATISAQEAIKRGREYLKKVGFTENMTDTYYSTYDGICTVNYAYEKDGITCYSDLIKVSISLETGKATAIDSRGYLMNHTDRKIKESILTLKDCRKILSPLLKVMSAKLAFIPLETGKEALCYEFHCRDKEGQESLAYINAENGKEENILLLLYSDDGVLTK
ncbi:MAG: germination protein YpeB [Clostridia bacterium]|nr:germination protein YpeB [Clostridia bacterium]